MTSKLIINSNEMFHDFLSHVGIRKNMVYMENLWCHTSTFPTVNGQFLKSHDLQLDFAFKFWGEISWWSPLTAIADSFALAYPSSLYVFRICTQYDGRGMRSSTGCCQGGRLVYSLHQSWGTSLGLDALEINMAALAFFLLPWHAHKRPLNIVVYYYM